MNLIPSVPSAADILDDDEPEPSPSDPEPTILTSTTTSEYHQTLTGPTEQVDPSLDDNEPGGLYDPTVPVWSWRSRASTENPIYLPLEFITNPQAVQVYDKNDNLVEDEYYHMDFVGNDSPTSDIVLVGVDRPWTTIPLDVEIDSTGIVTGFKMGNLNSGKVSYAWKARTDTVTVTTALRSETLSSLSNAVNWRLYPFEDVAVVRIAESPPNAWDDWLAKVVRVTGDSGVALVAGTDYTRNVAYISLTATGMTKITDGVLQLVVEYVQVLDWEDDENE